MPVDFTYEALADLELIEDYIKTESGDPEAARAFIETLVEGLQVLDAFPYAGIAREDLAPNLRQYQVKSYLALYEATDTGVTIKVVTRKGRDLRRMLGQ